MFVVLKKGQKRVDKNVKEKNFLNLQKINFSFVLSKTSQKMKIFIQILLKILEFKN